MKRNILWISLLSLALPAIIENFMQSIVGFVDIFFISQLGLVEVAAVGITNAILQIYFAIFISLGTVSTIFVSRYLGKDDENDARRVVTHSIMLSIVIGLMLGFISFFFAESLLSLLGAEQEVLDVGIPYFKIVTVPSILISLMFTIGAILRGAGDTKTPMRVGIWMNLIHIVLDYVLIFGVFFEGFGLVGAAIATVLARLIGVCMLFRYLYKKELLSVHIKTWRIRLEMIAQLTRIGLPAALERLFMRSGQIIYFGMIIRMGTEVYAAHTLTGNFTIFSSIVGAGLSGNNYPYRTKYRG